MSQIGGAISGGV